MIKKIFAITMVAIGSLSIIWGVGIIVGGEFVWGNKYTPEGRDGSVTILSILLGALFVAWGAFEFSINSKERK